MSRTQEAIRLVENGMSAYAAAKLMGISAAAVSRGLARKKANDHRRCPCCSQVIRESK